MKKMKPNNNTDAVTLFFAVLFLLWATGCMYAHFHQVEVEGYAPTSSTPPRTIVGQAKRVHLGTLVRTIPNIIPLHKQPTTWIVNVPLTPFQAPLKAIQRLDSLPSFLLYKQQYLSKIQEQGDCGSCFAFATGHMLSDRLAITTRGRFRDNVSIQQLISCYDKNACDGGSPEDLCVWMAAHAFRVNTVYREPYVQKSGGTVKTECRNWTGYRVGIVPNSVRSIVQFVEEEEGEGSGRREEIQRIIASNVKRMKTELMTDGPFYCAMTVYDDLFTYSGLKPYTPSKNATLVGGHAIEIIGYCEANTDPRLTFSDAYWICRNSWGTKWPRKVKLTGYFTVPMGRNVCGIESRCGSATPILEGYVDFPSLEVSLDSLRITDISMYVSDQL